MGGWGYVGPSNGLNIPPLLIKPSVPENRCRDKYNAIDSVCKEFVYHNSPTRQTAPFSALRRCFFPRVRLLEEPYDPLGVRADRLMLLLS